MPRNKRLSGYAGYYKENYLRSTLEFIYASYLDFKGILWTYEPNVYYLENGVSYKPDFVLADGSIIEIKGDYYLEEDTKRLAAFSKELGLEITILTAKDLRLLLRPTSLSFEALSTLWKQTATRSVDVSKDKNPRYQRDVSLETRQRLSDGVKKAWSDSDYRFKQSLRKGKPNLKLRRPRAKRTPVICPTCGASISLTEHQAKKRIYCSLKCSRVPSTTKVARSVKIENKNKRHEKIKDFVLQYAVDNYQQLHLLKLNRLQDFLAPIISNSYELTGIKDIRVIAEAVTGQPTSSKDLIIFLQAYTDDVRRAIGNNNL